MTEIQSKGALVRTVFRLPVKTTDWNKHVINLNDPLGCVPH